MQAQIIDIKLTNVRLSFPSLFQPKAYEGNQEAKYEATFLIPKADTEQIEKIRAGMKEIGLKQWPGGFPKSLKVCLQDGDQKEYDGYEDTMYIKASSRKRPAVIDRVRSPITEADNIVYAGCYVNCVIQLWTQDNTFGKRINASLLGVQFVRDGEAFGKSFDVNSAFEPLDKEAPPVHIPEFADGANVPDESLPF